MAEPDTLPLIRVQLCLMKKDEVTDEFFHNYWRGNHVKLALENRKFVEKVLRYNQVSCILQNPYSKHSHVQFFDILYSPVLGHFTILTSSIFRIMHFLDTKPCSSMLPQNSEPPPRNSRSQFRSTMVLQRSGSKISRPG
jgi:hypothetical protein